MKRIKITVEIIDTQFDGNLMSVSTVEKKEMVSTRYSLTSLIGQTVQAITSLSRKHEPD